MKIKKGFILKKLNENTPNELNVVIAVGEVASKVRGYIKLNESAVILWNKLVSGADFDELVSLILSEFEIDKATAEKDVSSFIETLKSIEAIDE